MSTQTGVDLPTSRQLLRSTLVALVAAGALLATVVLPAEYGVDPTGVGRALGLKQMGEIKQQLSAEAAADRAASQAVDPCGTQRSGLSGPSLVDLFISRAAAAQPAVVPMQLAKVDEVAVPLKPGQGAEIKLTMKKGGKVTYSWKVEGGAVNHDTHGERVGSNASHSYRKGTAVTGDEGVLEAAFDGVHGWFWRNRGQSEVTVLLKIDGDYADVKRMM